MPEADLVARYQALLGRLDRWAEEAAARHPGVIPCRMGCTACCHGPFDISAADAALLRAGLATLPADRREAARQRAQALLRRFRELFPDWGPPYDVADLGEDEFDELADALADEPCPLLGADGSCELYAWRPAVCRMMGLGMRTPQGDLDNACPIRFRFPEYAALAPQPFDLAGFEREEEAILAELDGPETTIAGVVAE